MIVDFRQKTAKDAILRASDSICGENMELLGFWGTGLLLSSFRALVEGLGDSVRVRLVTIEGGFALKADVGFGIKRAGTYWLVSEHSQRLRVFKRVDTALALCQQFGLASIVIDLVPQLPSQASEAA